MGAATVAIGLLPGYASIGVAAPILLILLRVLQGFAVAGEYSTSTIFLIEHAPPGKRGYISSWSTVGQFFGLLLGSGVGALVSSFLTEAEVQSWGWRVPFLASVIITGLGFYFRSSMTETPAIETEEVEEDYPVVHAVKTEWRTLLIYMAMIVMTSVGWAVAFIYAVNDLTQRMHVSTAKALDINTIAMFGILLITPFAGALSDRIGRKPLAIFAAAGTALLGLPLWWLIHHENAAYIAVGQLSFALLFAHRLGGLRRHHRRAAGAPGALHGDLHRQRRRLWPVRGLDADGGDLSGRAHQRRLCPNLSPDRDGRHLADRNDALAGDLQASRARLGA